MNHTSNKGTTAQISRRTGIATGIATAVGLVAPRASDAAAWQATPGAATPEPGGVQYLFVQSFLSSELVSDSSAPDRFILTLRQDTGQTLYFSDRPSRIAGVIDTARFVLGFAAETADDPANAALVAQSDPDNQVTHVVELLTLEYDADSHTATYVVRMIGEEEAESLPVITQTEQAIEEPRQYGTSQLFIDAGGLMQLVAYGAQDIYGPGSGGGSGNGCN
jgi:hypothetical protein